MGTPYDAPSRVTYPQQHYPLQGPVEGATGRAHLARTTSGSQYTSHAILSNWLIVCRFFPPKLLRKPRYGAFRLFAKTPRDDPTEYNPHNTAALAYDRLQRCHFKQTTTHRLWSSAQAVPSTPFGDRCRPLLPPTANENRSYKPAAWPTPLRRSKDFSELEDYKPAPLPTPS